jgi:hypothetical protein
MYRSLWEEVGEDVVEQEIQVRQQDTYYTMRPYQEESVRNVFERWEAGDVATLVCLPTGCHAPGHRILMCGGETNAVEDVRVGDFLTGPNGTPRQVVALHSGIDDMFRIRCKRGPEFVVNAGHILHLESTSEGKQDFPSQRRGGEIDHISVSDYLRKSKTWRHLRKLKTTGVEFCDRNLSLDPYFVGVMLGDGSLKVDATICHSQNQEVIDEVSRYAETMGCRVHSKMGTSVMEYHILSHKKWARTPLKDALRSDGFSGMKCNSKWIPKPYKLSPMKQRLHLLAGLMDTDGSLSAGGVFDFISKSPRLAEDVQFVARSVGLRANMSECQKSSQHGTVGVYYRLCISGDIERIPCRVPYKMPAPRRQKKDWSRYGFTVEPVGRGEYFGFTVDGDHLYVDGNFMIHHNCGKTVVFSEVMRRFSEMN